MDDGFVNDDNLNLNNLEESVLNEDDLENEDNKENES